jgi:hypothetical protein
MINDYTKQFSDFNEKYINTDWLKTTTESCKAIAEKQRELADSTIKDFTAHIGNMTKVKTPQEFWNYQQTFLHENLHRGMRHIQESLAILVEQAEQLEVLLPCCHEHQIGKKTKKK